MHFTFFERVNILSLDVFNEFVGLTCCPSTSGHFQKEDAFSFFAYCIFYSKMPFILILTHKSVCSSHYTRRFYDTASKYSLLY